MNMRFEPPTVRWRGRVANLMAAVYRQRPAHGEASGTLACICGARLLFNIQSTGISRGRCSAGCGVRWHQ